MDSIQMIAFQGIPQNMEQFKALPECAMTSPFQTAALTVLALSVYPTNKDLSVEMLNYLRGPRQLSVMEIQFIRDRFMDKDYVPRSYFSGATPGNDYTPSQPLSIRIGENPYSYQNEGYAKLFLKSGGADSPREIVLRLAKDGKWYLWDQFLLAGIREPESENPWA
ncbi:MAG: hypothetical protein IKE65_02490 [Clostridia bacterium]|nr:hypothetical protein [Clostridia bacterium]